ncbi:MAG TPA: DUF1761 domain-containing protein [Ignavibacteriales bacterium]|nr:DUF1761 domain-containing protein [Ignavibacteriales bacterium]
MESSIDINYLAVIVMAIFNFILGGLWFSPPLFGKLWMELISKKREELMNPAKAMSLSFITTLVTTYFLAYFINLTGANTFMGGMVIGAFLWIGFTAATSMNNVIFEGKPLKLYIINASYYLVCLIISGGVLALWR